MPSDLILQAIKGFRLVSADPARLAAFYRAIGFETGARAPIPSRELDLLGLSGKGWRIPMTLGKSCVDLESFDPPGQPYPHDSLANDLIFQHFALVTSDMKAAWQLACEAGATPISLNGPVPLPASAGGVTAVKFRDPEGHPLEFLAFPPGTNPHWNGTGIMGVDHSAISVSDPAASRQFYARHGLRETDGSRNHGPSQVALDGLQDVTVDVVPMNPAQTPPHLELLGYRTPAGRAHAVLSAHDIAATRIVWQSSSNAVMRDPDGHIQQVES